MRMSCFRVLLSLLSLPGMKSPFSYVSLLNPYIWLIVCLTIGLQVGHLSSQNFEGIAPKPTPFRVAAEKSAILISDLGYRLLWFFLSFWNLLRNMLRCGSFFIHFAGDTVGYFNQETNFLWISEFYFMISSPPFSLLILSYSLDVRLDGLLP